MQRDDIDAVCLTTESGSYFQIGMEAMKAGKHLLVKKPIAMTSGQAEEMIQTAEKQQVTLPLFQKADLYLIIKPFIKL